MPTCLYLHPPVSSSVMGHVEERKREREYVCEGEGVGLGEGEEGVGTGEGEGMGEGDFRTTFLVGVGGRRRI